MRAVLAPSFGEIPTSWGTSRSGIASVPPRRPRGSARNWSCRGVWGDSLSRRKPGKESAGRPPSAGRGPLPRTSVATVAARAGADGDSSESQLKHWTMCEAGNDPADSQVPRRSAAGLLALPWVAGQEVVALVVIFEGAALREVNQIIGDDRILRHEHVVCLPDRVAVLV
jgi:hypothetical protein